MPLTRSTFTIWLDDPTDPTAEPAEHTVTVRPADMMVGEETAARNGMANMEVHRIGTTVCWVHAASRRLGIFTGEFQQFRALLAHIEEHGEAPEVPPTEEPSGSDSSSPSGSETPATG